MNIQAQYGISENILSNQVTKWVDATDDYANTSAKPTISNRKLIKAIRIAVVARNNKIENEVVSFACSAQNAANPTGLCAWAGTATSPSPAIDLTATPNWNRYRYRVFETVIPLRNMVWNLKSL